MEIGPRETGDMEASTERKRGSKKKKRKESDRHGSASPVASAAVGAPFITQQTPPTPIRHTVTPQRPHNHFYMASSSSFTSLISLLLLRRPNTLLHCPLYSPDIMRLFCHLQESHFVPTEITLGTEQLNEPGDNVCVS